MKILKSLRIEWNSRNLECLNEIINFNCFDSINYTYVKKLVRYKLKFHY